MIDTRWLNEFQRKIKFKYEALSTCRGMFEEDDEMFSIDIQA